MHFAFHKYVGSQKAVSIEGINIEKVSDLICETHEDIERGYYTAYKVERIEWPRNVKLENPKR